MFGFVLIYFLCFSTWMHFSFTVFPLQTNENRAHSLNSFLLPKLVRGNCKFRITAVPFFFVLLQFPAWSLNETCWQVPSMRNCYGFDGPQPVPAGLPAFPGRDCSWAQLEFVLVHTFIFSTCFQTPVSCARQPNIPWIIRECRSTQSTYFSLLPCSRWVPW